jgi:hypothetical protein
VDDAHVSPWSLTVLRDNRVCQWVRVVAMRDQDRAELELRAKSKAEPTRVDQQARTVLLSEQGLSARRSPNGPTALGRPMITWRRYTGRGLAGLAHAPRLGGLGRG